MVSPATITFETNVTPVLVPPSTRTVAAIIGTGLSGGPSAAVATPTAVNELGNDGTDGAAKTGAYAAFGLTGTIIDACKAIYALTPGVWVVGVRYDHTASGAALQTAKIAAINALRDNNRTGHVPNLIAVPVISQGDTPADGDAAAIVAALQTTADRLKAIGIVDGVFDTVANCVAYATANAASRILIASENAVTPEVSALPGASFILAQRVRRDADAGYWDSLSNIALTHISGVSHNRSFDYANAATEGQVLRQAFITPIVFARGAYRLYGMLVDADLATGPLIYAVNVRVKDEVERALSGIAADYIDRALNEASIGDLCDHANVFLGHLVNIGALESARCIPDPVRNTPEARAAHRMFVVVNLMFNNRTGSITINLEI